MPGTKAIQAIQASVAASRRTIGSLGRQAEAIERIGAAIVRSLRRGGQILTAGNGGSGAEAMHMAEELVGRFKGNRRSLPGIALLADPTALTCIGNDFGFDEVFRRSVEGLARKGDVLVLFSTSGRSKNLQNALEAARKKGVISVCLLGRDGGPMAGQADHEVIVRTDQTARIQEAHQVVMHILLEIVESAFPPPDEQRGRPAARRTRAGRAASRRGGH